MRRRERIGERIRGRKRRGWFERRGEKLNERRRLLRGTPGGYLDERPPPGDHETTVEVAVAAAAAAAEFAAAQMLFP